MMPEPINKQQAAHVCHTCGSSLVQPTEWIHVDEQRWEVSLRCPECFALYDVTLEQDDVNQFSYQLEQGFQSLLDGIDKLDHESFQSRCETFIAALWAGGIYPMDF